MCLNLGLGESDRLTGRDVEAVQSQAFWIDLVLTPRGVAGAEAEVLAISHWIGGFRAIPNSGDGSIDPSSLFPAGPSPGLGIARLAPMWWLMAGAQRT